VSVYYAGVTVYVVGQNICSAAWSSHAGAKDSRRAMRIDTGEALPMYVEFRDIPQLTAFVPYDQSKQFPVPEETCRLVQQLGLGYMEQWKAQATLLLPSMGNA
jgi:hypothetical protein